jgi:predicted nucleic acid-binding protein
MKNKAIKLATYSFKKGEPLLFDANVWLYLYPAPSGPVPGFAATYSAALKGMLAADAHLVMDAMILSEYLNRYCRIEWSALHQATHPAFKAFRNSGQFAPVGAGAATFARNMLKICTRHDHPFSTTDVTQVLVDFEAGTSDFNDGLVADACRRHGWKLVTNDGDFINGGIEVLTNNPKLLAACP